MGVVLTKDSRLSYLLPNQVRHPCLDLDWMERGDDGPCDLDDGDVDISFRQHLYRFAVRTYDMRHPMPCPIHQTPKSYKSLLPSSSL